MTSTDWNLEAKRAAEYFAENHFQAHRGAMPWQTRGVCVVFGNDGYRQDERTRVQVEKVRESLAEHEIEELGFGLTSDPEGSPEDDGYTWAMIVRTDDHGQLTEIVWNAWEGSGSSRADKTFRFVQEREASRSLAHAKVPDVSCN